MFEFCWFISELIVWIFYGCILLIAVGSIYNLINPEDEETIMAKIGEIVSFNFDD